MRPYWVTLEGIEGVGKTHFARLLAGRLGERCCVLSEVTDQAAETLPGQVITALSQAGDLWLRSGHPATETLALLALKVSEYESVMGRPALRAEVVVEDRGVDSVAIYQAAILAGPDAPVDRASALVQQIYATAAHWRPLPDCTLLLVDDFDVCVARFEQRTGRTASAADRALMSHAQDLYAILAAREPARVRTVNRAGRSEEEILEELCQACTRPQVAVVEEKRCAT
jgi:dTMP kinase